jgi:D-3-phosphoglycerate dehydrogenase
LKIVIADDLPASALELLRAEASWVVDARSGRKPDALAADMVDADAIMVRSATVTAALMDAAPGSASSRAHGHRRRQRRRRRAGGLRILVVNAPGANSISVAEHACALLLALAR